MSDQLERVKTALELVRYRPGWTITAHPCPFGNRVWILIDAEVPDAEKPCQTTRVGVRAVVPAFAVLEQFYEWLAWRLKRVERHESREFFWVAGGPWDSPHKTAQPKHDYLVRKVGGRWEVQRPDGYALSAYCSWRQAYAAAWRQVISDDLAKPEDMING